MNIAIIAGGPSEEREISLNSAKLITDNIDLEKYTYRLLIMGERDFIDQETGIELDLNDFSLPLEGADIRFDFAFIMIHGRPAEDGKLQGYLDWMGIPYSTCGVLCSALTFNKEFCKNYLSPYDIPMARSVKVRRGDTLLPHPFEPLGWPVFVKPNNNGSSVAVTKVHRWEDLPGALEKVWKVDNEALVEEFIDGVEFSSSILKVGDQYYRLPITEIRPMKEFFDYEAKYQGASEEITPARLNKELTDKCLDLSEKIFRILDCSGVCRF